MENTMLVQKNPWEQREQLHKIPLNHKLVYATGPRAPNTSINDSTVVTTLPMVNADEYIQLQRACRCDVTWRKRSTQKKESVFASRGFLLFYNFLQVNLKSDISRIPSFIILKDC